MAGAEGTLVPAADAATDSGHSAATSTMPGSGPYTDCTVTTTGPGVTAGGKMHSSVDGLQH